MIRLTLAGRVLERTTTFRVGAPGTLKSAYRGPRAGSREAGTLTVDLFFLNGYQTTDLWFEEGAEVTAELDGTVWFRGVVTGIDAPARRGHKVTVEAMEDAGRLAELDTGMLSLGGLINSGLYCWVVDGQPVTVGTGDHNDPVTAHGSVYRASDYFPSDFEAARRGYRKAKLFDTHGYKSNATTGNSYARRTLLMYEQPVSDLVRRLRSVISAAGGPGLSGVDIDVSSSASGKVPQMYEPIRDESGATLMPQTGLSEDGTRTYFRTWGLFARNLSAQHERGSALATLYWRQIDENGVAGVELWQILNHSSARKLGRILMHTRHWGSSPGLDEYVIHHFEGDLRQGPFGVYDSGNNLLDFPKVAWYWVWGFTRYNDVASKFEYVRRATVYEVDLRQVLDDGGEVLGHTRYELERFSENPTITPDWVIVSEGQYQLFNGRQPLVQWTVERTGGRYEISRDTGALGPVFWIGDLYLSDVACEFEGTTIADVLHNLGLATGCEWFIDGAGRLVFRKVRQTTTDATVRAARLIDDYNSRRPADRSDGEDVSGIPVSDLHQVALRLANRETQSAIEERRTTKLIPDRYDFELGQEIVLDGESLGKLVSKSADYPIVTLECEP